MDRLAPADGGDQAAVLAHARDWRIVKVVVIGGSGHIGTYLIPRLVRAGHDVTSISRGMSRPYAAAAEWDQVHQLTADRSQEDRDGTFAARIATLQADAVIDLVCFTIESATSLVEALRNDTGHLVHCGSIWRYGRSRKLPIREGSDAAEPPTGEYGIQKNLIAEYLKSETAAGGLVTTSLHPGHIVGPGWHPIGPLGNLDPSVWTRLASGEPLLLPGDGTATMHHVHADDLAQAFEKAVGRRSAAAGEDFTVVAPSALSARGFAAIAAGWFGQQASLDTGSWESFRESTPTDYADQSWEHLNRSQFFSIEKASALLGYAPAYEPDAAVLESLRWLVQHDELPAAVKSRLRN